MVGIVNKPDINYGIWASNGDVAVPSSEKVEIGHIVEKPKKEIVNWIENRQDQFMAYLNQVGIPEWDSKTTYKANISFVNRSGTVYKAKSQNIDKDPTLNQDIWGIAWSTYEDYLSILEDIAKIRTQEGYLGLYVSKSNPIMEAPSQGVAYGFTDDSDTGLVKDNGGNPAIQKDGVVVASFDQLEDDNSVVRFSDLRKYLEFYKVGDLYLTTLQGNPKDILGYGTWARYAEGRSLVGMSSQESSPTWTKFIGSTDGAYDNTITFPMEDWKPQSSEIRTSIQGRIVIGTGNTEKNEILESLTQPIADQSLIQTNIQPSTVVAVWKRTA